MSAASDLCRNPECEFYQTCKLQAAAPEEHPGAKGLLPAAPKPQNFKVCETREGRVGLLSVEQTTTNSFLPELEAVEEALPEIRGLFVYWNSRGGSLRVRERIEMCLLLARSQGIPVVSFVARAQSSAQLAVAISNRIFMDGGGFLGGFGLCFHYCDGLKPRVVSSRQSPAKYPAEPSFPPQNFWACNEQEEKKVERGLNDQFEEDLRRLAVYRKLSAERLRPAMDGRDLLARSALRLGLVDEIAQDEGEAFEHLLGLIKIKKREGM